MNADAIALQRLFGTDQTVPPAMQVDWGRYEFEVQGCHVRRLCVGGIEVLRGAGLVVRDAWWGSHALVETGCRMEVGSRAWRRIVEGEVSEEGVRLLAWQVVIQIEPHRVILSAQVTAQTPFSTCRTGLMVLHPLQGVVGAPVQVTHSDGSLQTGCFPDLISPGQPFFDIQGLAYSPARGLNLHWHFSGDVFEMEDQRNWADASFKTYNRPLAWPCPYVLESGETLRQRVILNLEAP